MREKTYFTGETELDGEGVIRIGCGAFIKGTNIISDGWVEAHTYTYIFHYDTHFDPLHSLCLMLVYVFLMFRSE